ncbi:hypothetical protein F5X96DRAFT_669249 [Biscogniauxia mediterranea]|nr:hypothetical protein F5X96DRAFT_669249 [Biscogniauxia mediterranea]
MAARALDVQGAVDWIAAVQPYLNGVVYFTIGKVHWSYENEGYFGPQELEVRRAAKYT